MAGSKVGNPNTLEADSLQGEIQRLQRRCIVELEQMQQFHAWLEDKRLARQACRVVGDSRTGKTIACDAYRLKYAPTLVRGEPPMIPVIYWQSPPESGPRELFEGLLDCLKYQLSRGTLSELRARALLQKSDTTLNLLI